MPAGISLAEGKFHELCRNSFHREDSLRYLPEGALMSYEIRFAHRYEFANANVMSSLCERYDMIAI